MNKRELEKMIAQDIHNLAPEFRDDIKYKPARLGSLAYEVINPPLSEDKRDIKQAKRKAWYKSPAFAVSSIILLIMIISGGLLAAYNTPVSYISVDINPSVVLSVNVFGHVLDVNPNNEDGEDLLHGFRLHSHDLINAIGDIVDEASKAGYMDVGDANDTILFSVYDNNENRRIKLEEHIYSRIKVRRGLACRIIMSKIGNAQYSAAREIGISPGKLKLIERIIEASPEYTIDHLKDKTIRELIKMLPDDEIRLRNRSRSLAERIRQRLERLRRQKQSRPSI